MASRSRAGRNVDETKLSVSARPKQKIEGRKLAKESETRKPVEEAEEICCEVAGRPPKVRVAGVN